MQKTRPKKTKKNHPSDPEIYDEWKETMIEVFGTLFRKDHKGYVYEIMGSWMNDTWNYYIRYVGTNKMDTITMPSIMEHTPMHLVWSEIPNASEFMHVDREVQRGLYD